MTRRATPFTLLTALLLFFAAAPAQAQVAFQGFEESNSDDWNYTPDYNFDNGTSGEADLTFEQIDVSGLTGVQISFFYRADGFDSGDELSHEAFFDGGSQGVVTDIENATSDGWEQVTIDVPDEVETVRLVLTANQNGGG
ncbi:MAG: hypothetical protein BRD40_02165, partial [Bacteroidetes bacterium QS_1_65_9]